MLSRLLTMREQALLLGLALAIGVGAVSLHLYSGRQDAAIPIPDPPEAKATAAVLRTLETAPVPAAPENTGNATDQEPPSTEPDPVSTPSEEEPRLLGVAAMGAVRNEGLYFMQPDARVADLLSAAGGAREEADLRDINRAAPLIDATTLTVPERATIEHEGNTLRFRRGAAPVYNPPAYTLSGAALAPASANTVVAEALPAPSLSGNSGLINLNTASQEVLAELPGIGPVLAERICAYRTQTPFASVADLEEVYGIGPKRAAALANLVCVQ